ncbi:MAG TPA: glycosyltransferase family 2 protein, partial [Planctomycetaceae bacterium]
DGLRHRIVYVDDGSSDGTADALREIALSDPAVTVLSLSRNFGHQAALSAGLEFVDADAVVMMDGDLQHPPALIPDMVRLWREGFDVVSAVRQHTADAGPFKRWTSDGFYRVFNRLSETQLVTGAADFCLLSRRAHRALLSFPERHRFLRGLVTWSGFRRAMIPFVAPERRAGTSKFTVPKMLRLAFDAVFSFSTVPVRVAFQFGAALVLFSLVYLVYVVGRHLLVGDTVPGWSSTLTAVLLLGGVQLLSIGILGQYVARIYEEVKRRPLYFVRDVIGAGEADPPARPVTSSLPRSRFAEVDSRA